MDNVKKVGKGVVKGATKGVTKVGKGAVKGTLTLLSKEKTDIARRRSLSGKQFISHSDIYPLLSLVPQPQVLQQLPRLPPRVLNWPTRASRQLPSLHKRVSLTLPNLQEKVPQVWLELV